MKRIIRGKVYDTDTAKQIGKSDPKTLDGSLFLKKTGEFFIFRGDQITPLTIDAAKDWAAKHLDTNTFSGLFGPIRKDSARKYLHLYVAGDARELLQRRSREEGISMGEIVERLIKGRCR